MVILPDASLEATVERATQIRCRIKELRVLYHEQELHITASMGVAALPHHSDIPEEVLKDADKALYQAKAEGRDRVVVAQFDD